MDLYILINRIPIVVHDYAAWSKWMTTRDRVVQQDYIEDLYFISTIFIGINHGIFEETPVLFETMVFECKCFMGEENTVNGRRYCTWDEAKNGHDEFVKEYKELKKSSDATVEKLLEKLK